jgi:hypothetical protein
MFGKVGDCLLSLTFMFTNQVYCPPEGTYETEPDEEFVIPSGAEIRIIDFGSTVHPNLVSIRMTT